MSLADKLKSVKVCIQPRCSTCGCNDKFEHNEDLTYIKCNNCGREYFGGKDELLEYNTDVIEEAKQEVMKKTTLIVKEELANTFKNKGR